MALETTYRRAVSDPKRYEEEYTRLHKLQKGLCAVCDRPLLDFYNWPRAGENPKGQVRGVLDHCHKSGVVRGLLCTRCNTVVGYVEHGLLVRARRYVDSFPSFVSSVD